jgi:hypothetical protein
MKDHPISISKVYVLLNKVLNTLIRRKFGKHYSIRLNALTFISNRSNVNYFQTSSEKITIKSLKPIHLNELLLIKEFLLFNINTALLCIDNVYYIEVVELDLKIATTNNYLLNNFNKKDYI